MRLQSYIVSIQKQPYLLYMAKAGASKRLGPLIYETAATFDVENFLLRLLAFYANMSSTDGRIWDNSLRNSRCVCKLELDRSLFAFVYRKQEFEQFYFCSGSQQTLTSGWFRFLTIFNIGLVLVKVQTKKMIFNFPLCLNFQFKKSTNLKIACIF